jgi:hypothetical protein
MLHRLLRITLLFSVVGLLLLVPLGASGPTFWTVATTSDFLRGRSEGVYISLSGQLTPGPAPSSRLSDTPAQVWSIAHGSNGTLWAGTGGDGRLIRLGPQDGEEETVLDAEEAHVFAVATAGDRVFAASSPEGRVYLIEGTAAPRVFFDPEEDYIWALAVDAADRLWVGVGDPAVIYRVVPDGTSEVVHRPQATHVTRLLPDGQGQILAGTESPGRLYRYGEDDAPFVVLDTDMAELSAVTTAANGVIWAAAVARGDEPAGGGAAATVAATIASTTMAGSNGEGSAAASTSNPRRSAIYRIDASGLWEEVWTTPDVVYDMTMLGDDVLVATGPAGRLYRITPDLDVSLFTGVDARQITRFATAGDDAPTLATANPGRVLSLGTARQTEAAYESEVHDTESVATWGQLRWDATGRVSLYTRSGNTARPDDSWSEWAGPYTTAAGQAITSPAARFVQWRAVFEGGASGPAPELRSVTVAYLPRNTRPVVSSLTLHPPGVVFKRAFVNDESAIAGMDAATIEARRPPGESAPSPPQLNERMFQRGLQTIAWQARDDDDDLLTFSVQYRRDNDVTWRELRGDLIERIYVWDTTTVADGRYVVRVVASDGLSNAADRALTGWRDSDIVEVDNTPPTITIERGPADRQLTVIVRDAQSAVEQVVYAIAGGGWQPVYPADGLADSPEERFVIDLPEGVEPSDVVIRATDRLQNVASRSAAAVN